MPILGFIGFGEAAFHICDGLRGTSQPEILAYDVMMDSETFGTVIHDRAQKTGVSLATNLAELIAGADFILCATSAKHAFSIAREASKYLSCGKLYADLNSASPLVKREIAEIVATSGAMFVDAAIMEIVPPHRHLVPIIASGSGACAFTDALSALGMNIKYISDTPGSSSAMKMFRSIFMKGLTSLLLETLIASSAMGVEVGVMQSISDTLSGSTSEQLANTLINRTAVSASRRVSEMQDVVSFLENLGVESFASQGTVQRLQWLCDIGLRKKLEGKVVDHYSLVLQAITEISNDERNSN